MTDDPQAENVGVFRTKDDRRVAVRLDKVEGVLELEDGAQIVTSSDTYVVAHPWPEVAGLVWPELFR